MKFQAVADTSVLMGLGVVESLPLLCQMFSTVSLPLAVVAEVRSCRMPNFAGFLSDQCLRATCLNHETLDSDSVRLANTYRQTGHRIHRGESEVLASAKKHDAVALTDDLATLRFARANNIACTGSLGILSFCKKKGWITACRPLVEGMVEADRHFAPQLVTDFLRREGEM